MALIDGQRIVRAAGMQHESRRGAGFGRRQLDHQRRPPLTGACC